MKNVTFRTLYKKLPLFRTDKKRNTHTHPENLILSTRRILLVYFIVDIVLSEDNVEIYDFINNT